MIKLPQRLRPLFSDMDRRAIKVGYKGKQIKVSVHPECLMEILDHLRDVVIGETTLLFEGDDFAVLDANATDDGRAEFQLPNPDPNNTGTTEYSVFIRVLGKPGGKIKMATCATDPYTGEEICSDLQVIEVRTEGKKKFDNVSACEIPIMVPTTLEITNILTKAKTIAIVGLSPKEDGPLQLT